MLREGGRWWNVCMCVCAYVYEWRAGIGVKILLLPLPGAEEAETQMSENKNPPERGGQNLLVSPLGTVKQFVRAWVFNWLCVLTSLRTSLPCIPGHLLWELWPWVCRWDEAARLSRFHVLCHLVAFFSLFSFWTLLLLFWETHSQAFFSVYALVPFVYADYATLLFVHAGYKCLTHAVKRGSVAVW